jgi:hypothetical protein
MFWKAENRGSIEHQQLWLFAKGKSVFELHIYFLIISFFVIAFLRYLNSVTSSDDYIYFSTLVDVS